MHGNVKEIIGELKLIPVVKLDSEEDAAALGGALLRGGLPAVEVTFRTEAAESCIRRMRREYPDMLIGAGTVICVEQAERALEAGAGFLVSPGTSEELLQFAAERQVPIFPGICTPSEIMRALAFGCDVVKFFPAVPYGGVKTIKALAAPFPQVKFMPTGGIQEENLGEFLALPQVIACGGSWMVKDSLIKEKQFDRIEELTRRAMALIKEGAYAGAGH